MGEQAYCASCRSNVAFETKDATRTTESDGQVYEYPVKLAICAECGKVATYKPYQELARQAFADRVREAHGLASLEIVQDLPAKYGIGKRPLSTLLGWGEVTYSRFANGLAPSPAYSDIIKRLHDDPKLFLKLLLSNRNRIASSAFEKSYQATQNALESECSGASKLISLANYLKHLSDNALDKIGVQKLIYYIQGFAGNLISDPIVTRAPKAWAYGPVYGEEYYYEVVTLDVPLDDPGCDPDLFKGDFTADELQVIDDVFLAFRPYSTWTWAEMTHSETPWLEARNRAGASAGEKSDERIPLKDIEGYFSRVIKEYDIQTSEDIPRYVKAKFQEIGI